MRNIATENVADLESMETTEWLESLDYVLQSNGPARAGQLLQELAAHARRRGIRLPFSANTPYVNTITADQEAPFPGSQELERRIKSLVRWNAIAMVVRATRHEPGIGGHISTFASAATLYEVGFNHFFRAAATTATATSCTSRDTPRPAFTRARFSKAASPRNSWTTSAAS